MSHGAEKRFGRGGACRWRPCGPLRAETSARFHHGRLWRQYRNRRMRGRWVAGRREVRPRQTAEDRANRRADRRNERAPARVGLGAEAPYALQSQHYRPAPLPNSKRASIAFRSRSANVVGWATRRPQPRNSARRMGALPTRPYLAARSRGQNCAAPHSSDRRARQFCPPYPAGCPAFAGHDRDCQLRFPIAVRRVASTSGETSASERSLASPRSTPT